MSIISRPHVVLLGAGASCAALQDFNGMDKYGRTISLMNNFINERFH